MARPVRNTKITADEIIRGMIPDEDDPRPYLAQGQGMQKFGLDELIRDQIRKRSFKPCPRRSPGTCRVDEKWYVASGILLEHMEVHWQQQTDLPSLLVLFQRA
jgi:hypothetical protein